MLESTPLASRLLAHSTRGYSGSSPFNAEDDLPDKLRTCLGNDLAAVLAAYISKLALLSHPNSSIKLISWSLGACSILSSYHLLSVGLLPTTEEIVLHDQISEIIFFEPPASLVFGSSPSASTLSQRTAGEWKSPADMFVRSLKQVTAFFDYPEKVFRDMAEGIKEDDVVFEAGKALADEKGFMDFVAPTIETGPMEKYVLAATPKTEEGLDYLRTALRALLGSPGVKRIGVLSTRQTIPDCIEGCAVLIRIIQELADDNAEQKDKIDLRIIDGDCNHFVLVDKPEALWESLQR